MFYIGMNAVTDRQHRLDGKDCLLCVEVSLGKGDKIRNEISYTFRF
jgi:hypothetical protein